MHAAEGARAKGAAIGVVTVPPRIATAALEATETLREHDLEADIHTPIGDPSPRSRGSLGSTRTTPSLSDDVGLGPCTGRSKRGSPMGSSTRRHGRPSSLVRRSPSAAERVCTGGQRGGVRPACSRPIHRGSHACSARPPTVDAAVNWGSPRNGAPRADRAGPGARSHRGRHGQEREHPSAADLRDVRDHLRGRADIPRRRRVLLCGVCRRRTVHLLVRR